MTTGFAQRQERILPLHRVDAHLPNGVVELEAEQGPRRPVRGRLASATHGALGGGGSGTQRCLSQRAHRPARPRARPFATAHGRGVEGRLPGTGQRLFGPGAGGAVVMV